MIICSGCGNTLNENLSFCTECGVEVPQRTSSPSSTTLDGQNASITQPLSSAAPLDYDYYHQSNTSTVQDPIGLNPSHTPEKTKSSASKNMVLVLGGVLLVAIALIAYLSTRSDSTPTDKLATSLHDAIASGRLVTLTGDDAYTYFMRLRELAPQHTVLKEVKPQVLVQLRNLGDEIVRKRTLMSLEILTERDWKIASQAYEWAHILEPNDKPLEARWNYAEGNVAKAQFRRDDARSRFSSAMQLDPSWAVPVNDFGFLYTIEKYYAEAIPYYQRAIDLKSDWDIPYNNMGTALFYQKDLVTAESWYRRSLQVNSNWATPHLWLGSIYEMRKENIAAAQEFQTAVNLYDPNRDKFDVAVIQNKANVLGR